MSNNDGQFGSPGEPTPPVVYPPPSYDPPIEAIDLSEYDIPRLGCGLYDVRIILWGNTGTVCASANLHLINITFNRRLNEISEGSVVLSLKGSDIECCDCLADVRPWTHELEISRDGEVVWVGPIMGVTLDLNANTLKVTARDLMAWFDKRVFEQSADYEVEDTNISTIFTDLMTHGYGIDPWGFTWSVSDVALPASRFYPGFDTDIWGGRYPLIGDELRGLVTAGVDYTVVNRQLFGGVVAESFDAWYFATFATHPTRPVLIDQHWSQLPQIEMVGTYMSNYTIVGGGYTGYFGWAQDQMWIESNPVAGDGTLQTVNIRNDMEDVFTDEHPNPITAEAHSRNEFNRNPYVILSQGQLANDAPLDFSVLIPGLLVDLGLNASCINLDLTYRIHGMSLTIDSESEVVNIELAPVGVERFEGG